MARSRALRRAVEQLAAKPQGRRFVGEVRRDLVALVLATEAVVTHELDCPLDAPLVLRAPYAGRVDREAARLGVLKNASMMRGVVGLATSTMVFVLSGTSALKTLP